MSGWTLFAGGQVSANTTPATKYLLITTPEPNAFPVCSASRLTNDIRLGYSYFICRAGGLENSGQWTLQLTPYTRYERYLKSSERS